MLDFFHPLDWHKLCNAKHFPTMDRLKQTVRQRYTSDWLDFEYDSCKEVYRPREFNDELPERPATGLDIPIKSVEYRGVYFMSFPYKLRNEFRQVSRPEEPTLSRNPKIWTQRYEQLTMTPFQDIDGTPKDRISLRSEQQFQRYEGRQEELKDEYQEHRRSVEQYNGKPLNFQSWYSMNKRWNESEYLENILPNYYIRHRHIERGKLSESSRVKGYTVRDLTNLMYSHSIGLQGIKNPKKEQRRDLILEYIEKHPETAKAIFDE